MFGSTNTWMRTPLAVAAGARVLIDGTFATPVAQKPLELGADLIVHSTTKYLDGHNATVGGAVVTAMCPRSPSIAS